MSSSLTHSPFFYHHVPHSPFLLPPRLQGSQSPMPFVPDIDNQRFSSHFTGRNRGTSSPYSLNQSFLSPAPVVPSISPTPKQLQAKPSKEDMSSSMQKEQVVPHFSPQLKGEEDSFNGKKKIQETSPSQTKVPEINLFSGDEIFA
ncbi:uncharacterized protein [Acropora muricata]|uniref:uncharacterized protein LOC114957872 n=1 Tax=Acropora millepora TaxID=45264 RepID=UPI001CF5FE72|nr:uncharacterized protein LOC114957872 [Acropora millepora]